VRRFEFTETVFSNPGKAVRLVSSGSLADSLSLAGLTATRMARGISAVVVGY
jgi:hypothetical protein